MFNSSIWKNSQIHRSILPQIILLPPLTGDFQKFIQIFDNLFDYFARKIRVRFSNATLATSSQRRTNTSKTQTEEILKIDTIFWALLSYSLLLPYYPTWTLLTPHRF